MDIRTSEVHERRHRVVLSKQQVELILMDYFKKQLGTARGGLDINVKWGDTGVDSGLGREPQFILDAVEDCRPSVTT